MLLAQTIALDIGTLFTIGGIVFGAGGVIGGLKLKQVLAANKTEHLKEVADKSEEARVSADKEILGKIEDLTKTMTNQFRKQNDKQAEAEKSMVGKIDNFKNVVVNRLDDMQQGQAELDKRITLAEAEHKHIKEKVDKHAKKITLMGHISRPPTYPGNE
jgi:uncharacterized phage infection (PIP) family protein YhgE